MEIERQLEEESSLVEEHNGWFGDEEGGQAQQRLEDEELMLEEEKRTEERWLEEVAQFLEDENSCVDERGARFDAEEAQQCSEEYTEIELERERDREEQWLKEAEGQWEKENGWMEEQVCWFEEEKRIEESWQLEIEQHLEEESGDTTSALGGVLQFLIESIEEKEKSLECPVCFDVASSPIFCCPLIHLICSACRLQVVQCPVCREGYGRQGATR